MNGSTLVGRLTVVTALVGLAVGMTPTPAAPAAPAAGAPARVTDEAAGRQQVQRQRAIERERGWATHPEVVAAAAYAERGEAPPEALAAAEKARVELRNEPGISAETTAMRDNLYDAATWYYDNQTITYTWSDYWQPCNMYQADCECFNRLVYWDAGWGQLWYTLRGQATTGYYTGAPRYGDLVFFDYDGDGWEGPYDHTGVYTGGGWVLHSSATYGYVLWSKVSVISAETWGGHWYVNIVNA